MTGYYKNIYSISLVVLIFVTIYVASKPVPEHSKIRIHVPVKHHTHYHTKTIIKHIPVKHEIEEVHKPYKYHHRVAEDDDEEDDVIWPHKPYAKKKKFHHPFIKK